MSGSLLVPAAVSQVSPLLIVMDGDGSHPVPAVPFGSYTPVVGDRVRVEVRRAGLPPIVQAVVS